MKLQLFKIPMHLDPVQRYNNNLKKKLIAFTLDVTLLEIFNYYIRQTQNSCAIFKYATI